MANEQSDKDSVVVPAAIFKGALNYIRHCGANQVMRGEPHPQQWIVDGLEAAAAVPECGTLSGATPRTDRVESIMKMARNEDNFRIEREELYAFARQLERELAEANKRLVDKSVSLA